MSEYIEREKAVAIIEEKQKELCPVGQYGRHYVYGSDRKKYDAWEEIIDALENLPTADVVEVRHARWIKHEGYDECEACHAKAIYGSNYCPSCGALMDKEDKHEAD